MRAVVAGVTAGLALALAGCGGGGGDPQRALAETANNLEQIRSGTMTVKLEIDPRGDVEAERFGFEINGPFAFRDRGSPLADVEYTQRVGDNEATVKIVSTGDRAFVVVDDQAYELPEDRAAGLRSAGAALGSDGGLSRFEIDDWVKGGELEDGDEIGGDETDKVEAELDVVSAVNDLIELAGAFGRPGLRPLRGADAEQLEEAVESSKLELWTGKDDRLLRRLKLELEFGFDVPEVLRRSFGEIVGAKVMFELGVERPNEPVRVAAPENPRPYSELER